MNTKRIGFSVRLIPGLTLIVILTFGLAYAVPVSPAEPAKAAEAPSLLQFTSASHVLGFEPGGMYAAAGTHALRVEFVEANEVTPLSADSDLKGFGSLEGLANAAPPFSTVTYPNLWDGVTLTYDATGIVRSTYRLEPYADPNAIRLRYNRPTQVQDDGSLRIEFETGALTETAPIAWQEIGDQRVPVDVAFEALSETEIGFAPSAYNPAQPLFIDPTLIWNTFLGGVNNDQGFAIAVDSSGNVYVAGSSNTSWGTPVNPHAGAGIDDGFAAKLDSSGVRQWHTFLGSSSFDQSFAIAVDSSGNLYVTGYSTDSWGTPVNPHAGGPGISDAFAAKLNSSGGLVWNTFMGSSGQDTGFAIAVDSSGNVYAAGSSEATWGTPVNPHAGESDAFAAKLNSGGGLVWNTFMGSSSFELGFAIAVDTSGNVYVAGNSEATWGTPINPHAGSSDAFAAKLNSGGGLVWNTFMGSSQYDEGRALAVDTSGNVYVAGNSFTESWGTPVNPHAGLYDAFAAKLNSSGGLVWNTFMGGTSSDLGYGIAVDSSGNVYVAGLSYATWGTPVNPYTGLGDSSDAFAAQFNSSGGLMWNTFMGSSNYEEGRALAVDTSGNVYVAGISFASWGTPVNPHAGFYDAFAAKIGTGTTPPPTSSMCNGQTATIYVNAQGKIVGGPNNGQVYKGHLTGTAGADVIVGTNRKDSISALGGNDVICGGGNNDELEAGAGNDRIFGEAGNDIMAGGGGNDTLTGGLGADRFNGGAGTDTATDFTPGQGDTKSGVENF